MRRPDQPDFLLIGAPKAGTTALHAALARHPDVFVDHAQGAEVLALRRRAATRLAGPRRRALAAGVGLAAPATTTALRARRTVQLRGESTPFYLWSRGAHRRIAEAPARRPPDRRGPRPDRPGVQQLDAPVVRRPRAESALRGGVRARRTSGSAPAGRRSGATATSAGTASSSRTSTGTSTPRGCWCCATATSSTSRARPWTGPAASSASRGPGRHRSRTTTPATSWSPAGARGARARGPRGRPGRPVRAARRSGAGPARPLISAAQRAGDGAPAAALAGAAGSDWCRTSPTTSRC